MVRVNKERQFQAWFEAERRRLSRDHYPQCKRDHVRGGGGFWCCIKEEMFVRDLPWARHLFGGRRRSEALRRSVARRLGLATRRTRQQRERRAAYARKRTP